MADADESLKTALREGQGDKYNVEKVDGDQQIIEMDVAMFGVCIFIR